MTACRIKVFLTLLIFFCFIPSLLAGNISTLAKTAFPACESFGVQRFQDKKVAPTFFLKTVDGKVLGLSDLKGKPILMTFWLSYCEACKEDLPVLEKLASSKKDLFTFVTIVADGEKEKKIRGIVEKYKLTAPALLDLKEKISHAYGVTMVPTSFLIDREGLMLGMIVGQRDWGSPTAWSAISELLTPR